VPSKTRTPVGHNHAVASAEDYLAAMEARVARLPEMVPVTDAAVVLGVCRQTVYNLLASGELAGIRTTKHGGIRLFRDSIIDYIKRRLT